LFGVQPGAPVVAATNVKPISLGPIRTTINAPADSWVVDIVASEINASPTPGPAQIKRFSAARNLFGIAGSAQVATTPGPTTLVWNNSLSRLVTSAVAFAARPEFRLTLSTTGSGTIQSDPAGDKFPAGTRVTLTATPAPGWRFEGWSGDLTGTDNPAIITMDREKSITANFTPLPPGITTQPLSQTVTTGSNVTFTISWCSFLGDDGGPGSFVRRQIEALDQNRPAYPMYDFLRSNGFSVEDIIAISRSQKKGSLVGANELDPANANHQVTLHHNYYLNMQDRLPRLRAGNAHAYDIYVNNAEAFAAKGMRDAIVAAMTPSNAAKLNGSNATYSFDVVLNGAISTEGGAVLLEKSQLIGVIFPLRNNQKDASLTQYTGKILALDTLYQLGGLVFRGDSNTPGSPLAPVPAPELAFSWNGFATLPYVYTTHDPTQLPLLLTGAEGAGAGMLIWTKENWLKTSY